MRDFRLQWSLVHGLYVNHSPLPKGKLGKRAKYKKLGVLNSSKKWSKVRFYGQSLMVSSVNRP
jgi:hypothetical protein